MKVLAYILSVLVATGLIIGGTFLILVQAPTDSSGLLLLAIGALCVFIYGPLILGSITSYWDVKKTGESRRYFRWWFGIVLGLSIRPSEPHPIARLSPTVRAEEPQWWCGSAPP
ncbi:hypothetical protein, partial [Cryobacterium sp. MDB2-10]|uniref:hypothetical protein n=1 Tax=Cryobacterium sp. MDB2-10 TaxID=1259177 RepID=UPI001A7EC555